MKHYNIYSYVQKGLSHREDVCEDTALLGNSILREGYAESVAGSYFLAGVADGIGGMPAGELASRETMKRLSQYEPDRLLLTDCRSYLEEINDHIRGIGETRPDCRGLGCTLTLLGNLREGLYVFQLGNSRLYKATDKSLILLTMDHNIGRDEFREGMLDEEELERLMCSPKAAYLTSFIGMDRERFTEKLEYRELKHSEETTYFLTTDGIHDHLSYEELSVLMRAELPPEKLLKEMAEQAVKSGSVDDISIVMVKGEE